MSKGQATPADQVAEALLGATLQMQAELPSGVVIVMRELTGDQEIAAAAEAGDISAAKGRQVYIWAQAMRSMVSIGGEPFDSSQHTAESFRGLFGAKTFQFVLDLFFQLNRPTEDEALAFRKSTRATV